MPDVRIETVRVVGRFRKDLGDIRSLAQSIAQIGLINAITITPDGRLIAGERRLEACRSLGWQIIGARVVDNLEDAADRLRAERDENTERKEMTVSERMELAAALEELERPRAAARKAAHGGTAPGRRANTPDPVNGSVQLPDVDGPAETREVVANAIGMSPASYGRAKRVWKAANDADAAPEVRKVAQEALAEMDATGNITAAHEKVRGARSVELTAPKKSTMAGAAQQRKALAAANTTLSGVCLGLSRIEDIHPDITSEEAAEWVDGLSEARLIIERTIKRLKERTKSE